MTRRTSCSRSAPGTGGDEATLFVAEIFRMYSRFAELQGWKVDVLSTFGVVGVAA